MLDRLRDRNGALVDLAMPSSEAFRTLRVSLQLRAESNQNNIILVTSAEPREGKSTVACNFARISAIGHNNVLLVDCDLRSPTVHRNLGVERSPGLVELLATEGDLSSFVQRIPEGTLDVLTAGRAIPRPGDLVSSHRVRDLLQDAAQRYDLVVIDSPPVLSAADAEGLASHPGISVLLVVKRKTRRRAIVKATRRLQLVDANIAGTVLNQSGRARRDYYDAGTDLSVRRPSRSSPTSG
jgi:capsular exopolysaccharide synthesis family protein